MVDNILISMIGADVAYAALHIICFTTTYETDENMVIQTGREIKMEDYIVIALYCVCNFAFAGIFRVLMIHVKWNPCQIIVFKLGIVVSSLSYVIVGFTYLSGNDELSSQLDEFNKSIVLLIEELLWGEDSDAFFLYVIPYLQREIEGLQGVQSTVCNFMLLYVFSNFAFSFEVVAKLSDFDGTADLKTKYELNAPEEEQWLFFIFYIIIFSYAIAHE